MHLWISELNSTLFNGFTESLNADRLPPSFKHGEADGKYHVEQLLFIRGDAMNVSLQPVSNQLHIS
jgi:hypothetical protein